MRAPIQRLVCVLALVIGASPARADDKAAAEAAFLEAKQLAKDGKWAEACPKFEISYHADPQLGALLNVADCHARIGRAASAWAEFHEAEELAAKKADPRESFARDRAAALEPLLDKLRIDPPAVAIAGLVVHRDGDDLTALLGASLPIDPGEHQLVATAPGYLDWKTTVTIAGEGTTQTVTIAALEKAPEAIVAPVAHDGTLHVTTRVDAEIVLDGVHVGVGHFDGTVSASGHTLRVVAPGMRLYQSEIVVGAGVERNIDVPLEPELAPPLDDSYHGSSAFVGVSTLLGVKLHGDHPPVVAYRVEIARRGNWYTSFGAFVEYGSIDASNACGTDLPGAKVGPFDFGPHDQFTRCEYLMGGLQFLVHILPRRRFDPYVVVAPAFRATFIAFTPFDPLGNKISAAQNETWPGFMANGRVGVDYRPRDDVPDWKIGALFETEVTMFGEEEVQGNAVHYVTLFGGVRSTYGF